MCVNMNCNSQQHFNKLAVSSTTLTSFIKCIGQFYVAKNVFSIITRYVVYVVYLRHVNKKPVILFTASYFAASVSRTYHLLDLACFLKG